MCKSYVCRIYFVSIFNGFILLVNVWAIMRFNNDLEDTGMIVSAPFSALFDLVNLLMVLLPL